MLPGEHNGLEDNSPCLSRAASELPCTGLDGGLPYSTACIFSFLIPFLSTCSSEFVRKVKI